MLVVKNLPANAGDIRDVGSIPGLRRSLAGGHSNPLQYSCLEYSMDRGAWQATVHRVINSQTWLKWLSSSSISSHNVLGWFVTQKKPTDTPASPPTFISHHSSLATHWLPRAFSLLAWGSCLIGFTSLGTCFLSAWLTLTHPFLLSLDFISLFLPLRFYPNFQWPFKLT